MKYYRTVMTNELIHFSARAYHEGLAQKKVALLKLKGNKVKTIKTIIIFFNVEIRYQHKSFPFFSKGHSG